MAELSIQEAIREFLKRSRLNPAIQAVRITEVWAELMGPTVAKYTDEIRISGHTLIIRTQVAPLRHELLYQRDVIVQRVNEALGESIIREVVIR